ncbi:unnamed protein product [Cylindrotheca closterium]|uniref:Uncharacterized protein n=1 Tax=Cylindrotheca closterium TaxID=2856 RepID=A0AAD2CS64_9STRA|nr:unnamed protein product [Cylindrotheca closterium]
MQTFPPCTLDAILQVGRSALTTVKDLPLELLRKTSSSPTTSTLISLVSAKTSSSPKRTDLLTLMAPMVPSGKSSALSSTDPPKDIHWPSGDGVFTKVKKFFPIYPGANIPPSLKLSTAPPSNLESFHPQFRLWYKAMKYLHDHNESQSLHSHAHIFSADTIPTDRFPDSDLATHLTYSPSTVSAFAAEVLTYKALFEEFKQHLALSTLASTNHVTTQEAPAAPLPAGAPFDSKLFAQIMANALKGANASTKEKDLARTSASAKDSFSLIFGRVKPVIQLDGSTVNEFHPSVLTDDFVTFLEIGSIKEALRHLHDTFAHITDTLTTRNNYDRNVNFDIALFQHATVTALKTCSFGVRPLTMHPFSAS